MQDCHVICISVKLILFLRFPKFCRCHTVNFFENSCKMTLGRKPQQTADLGEILLRFQQQCFCLLHSLLLDKIRQRPACLLFEFHSQSAAAFAAVCCDVCGANRFCHMAADILQHISHQSGLAAAVLFQLSHLIGIVQNHVILQILDAFHVRQGFAFGNVVFLRF